MVGVAQFEDVIGSRLAGKDVAMLILNAGVFHIGPLEKLRYGEIEEAVTLNSLHTLYLLRVMLPQMKSRVDLRRGVKSAVVFVGSQWG